MENDREKSLLGKRVVDLSEIVDVFEAQEGEVQQIIGKTGNGKTYEATRRALKYLRLGYTVYTTWQLILPEYYDEREDKEALFIKTVLGKKHFYRFNFKENWHFLDIDRPDLVQFIAGLTDCIVMLDEGQDIFDSRERMEKSGRKTITRTRHMHKTLIIISQRAQAVDVTARANVTFFYKCVKTVAWWWPFKPYFKVYRTEEMDNQNFPIWEAPMDDYIAPVYYQGFLDERVANAYNSWYLRAGIPKSQELSFEVYELTIWEKLKLLFRKNVDNSDIQMSEEMLKELEERNLAKFKEDTSLPQKKARAKKSNMVELLNEKEKRKNSEVQQSDEGAT